MNQAVDVVLPVFGLIGIGYLASLTRLIGPGGDQALADFCYNIAIPLLIFKVVATADFSGGSPWLLWLAYYIAFAIVWRRGRSWCGGFSSATRGRGSSPASRRLTAMRSSSASR